MERNIVIIDNNFAIREILKISLDQLSKNSGEDFNLYTSQNGIEGLGFVYITHPEIVIIDTTLPKYSGNELLYFLLSNKKFHTEKVKILVLTEKKQRLRVPTNFTVLDKSAEDFIPKLNKLVSSTLKISPENKEKPGKLISKILYWANSIDVLQVKFSKEHLLGKLMLLPGLLLLELLVSLLLTFVFITRGHVSDSNVKQEKRDLSLLRRRHYPTAVGSFIAVIIAGLVLLSFVFSQNLLFNEVSEETQAFGYGEIGWYSNMDSASDVTNPIDGTAAQVLNDVDFVTQSYDLGDDATYEIKAARFNANNEVIRINNPIKDSDYNLEKGTVEFMYSPLEDHTADKEMTFFSIYGDDDNKIEFKKLDDVDDSLSLKYICDYCADAEVKISGTDYEFSADGWVTFVVHWNAYAPSGQQLLILVDGESPLATQSGSVNPASIIDPTAILIGNSSASGTNHANGLIDEFKIYLDVSAPSATPIGTPPPTPVYTQGSGQPSWYSTMDSISAVTTPQFGDAPGVFSGASFTDGPAGFNAATNYDVAGKSIYVEGIPGVHYSLNEGAVEFYYRPSVEANFDAEVNLFSIRLDDDEEIRLFKKNNAGSNQLTFSYLCKSACGGEETISLANYDSYWNAGEWMFIRVTWNDNAALILAEQMKIFINGVQPPHTNQAEKILGDNISTDPDAPVVYIGNRTEDGANPALGAIDEFKMFTTTIIPTPTPTLTPTITLTPSATPIPSTMPTATPTPLYYSTLDSIAAVTNPVYGQPGVVGGGVKFLPGSPFVSESESNKAANYYYKSPDTHFSIYVNTNAAAVNETTGRVTFWFRPDYSNFDNKQQYYFKAKIDSNNRIAFLKTSDNKLVFEYLAKASGANNYNRLEVAHPNYDWLAGEWIYFELTWNTALSQDDEIRMFLSKQGGPLVEPVHTHTNTVTTPMGNATKLVIGGQETPSMAFPNGRIDDFKLYGYYNPLPTATVAVVSPTPTPLPAFNILWYSTLANPTAAWQPVIGHTPTAVYNVTWTNDGNPQARPAGNFTGQANIQVPIDGTHNSPIQGRVEFWYKPAVAHTDSGELGLFRIRGNIFDKISLRKLNNAWNSLEFQYDASCTVMGTANCDGTATGSGVNDHRKLTIAPAGYSSYWVVNKWVKFIAEWDYNAPTENERLRLSVVHHNGTSWVTTQLTGTHAGILDPNKMTTLNYLYIGNLNYYPYSAFPAKGAISEFQIWGIGVGVSPTPSPTPVPLTAADPIWYSTLDNAAAITTPVIGKGATASNVTYESGVNSNAARIDANSEHITVGSIPATDFKKDKGAIEFYYKPLLEDTATGGVAMFYVTTDSNNQLTIWKDAGAGSLWLIYKYGGSQRVVEVKTADYTNIWQANVWMKVRVEWDRSRSYPNDLKIYFNDISPTVTNYGSVFSDFTGTPTLVIGNWWANGTNPIMGIVDDFTIFGDPDTRRYVVNTTSDDADANVGDRVCATAQGQCSLRAAIQEANNTVATDSVRFNIAGGGPHVININSPLPNIVNPLNIDATTQSGTVCSSSDLKVVLAGNNTGGNGLSFTNISSNQVKGLVIYGFNRGISVTNSSNNVFTCNMIGLDSDGETIRGNSGYGIFMENSSNNNTIGGADTADINIISGNGRGIGVKSSTGTTIRGNYIGTNKSGTFAKGNMTGIEIDSSANNIIGNQAAVALPASCSSGCNLISGNSGSAIAFLNGSSTSNGNTIKANYLGTNQAGTDQIVNYDGIKILKSSTNTIQYNLLVSINSNVYALSSAGANLAGLDINNNIMGTNKNATAKLIDSTYGVVLFSSSGSTITSSNVNSNIIGGAVRGAGVYAYGTGVSGLTVKSNYIGTNSSSADLGNKYGIHFVSPNSSTNIIGGETGPDGNAIAFNTSYGIYLSNTSNSMTRKNAIFSNASDGIAIVGNNSSVNNTMIENSIYENAGLGINLRTSTSDKVTYNDTGDTDSTAADDGPNDLQNFPILTKAIYVNPNLTLYGGFQSRNDKYYRLDFYSSDTSDPSGFGEGKNHFHTATYNGANGVYNFSSTPLNISVSLPAGHRFISATATECLNSSCNVSELRSTSEFGFTGYEGDFLGKDIFIDRKTGTLDKLYITGDGMNNITDVFAYNINPDGSLDFIQGVNVPGMSAIGTVSLDNGHFAVAGQSETNQYRVYSFEDGLMCSYNLGTNEKVVDIELEENGVGSKYVYLASSAAGKQFTIIQGLSKGDTLAKYGEYLSEVRDMGTPIKFYHSISWNETLNNGKVKLQIRSGNTSNLSSQEWYGPDGTRGSYYELNEGSTGDVIPKVVQGKRYLQYRLLLEAGSLVSPALDSITIRYGD